MGPCQIYFDMASVNSDVMKKQFVLLFFLAGLTCHAQDTIDLSGKWNLSQDSLHYTHDINLPGSTDEICLGQKHMTGSNLYTGHPETWQLARKHVYIGKAWYTKEIEIPDAWIGKELTLSLERCMWQSKLYVNDRYVSEQHSLCAPHRYDISQYVRKGKNKLCLSIDNRPYVHLGSWSHGYAPGIQTIWNGAVGDLFIEARDVISVKQVKCYPSFSDKTLRVEGKIANKVGDVQKGTLRFTVLSPEGKTVAVRKEKVRSHEAMGSFSVSFQLPDDILEWSEFSPNLYKLKVDYRFGKCKGTEEVSFGFRDVLVENGRLLVNGRTTFLRGEHDAGSFPLTGYPSMEKEDWIKIFRNGKQFGLNHWRFHSWCPPEAAFAAADEVGIYLQPELTLFSQDWEHTLVGQDSSRDQFLFSELKQLLDVYGNHPSFLLMCMGNELRGDASVLEQWVDYGKKYDSRHLYAGSANLEAMAKYLPLKGDDYQVAHAAKVGKQRYERRMGGYFNTEKPNTVNDYSHTLTAPYDKVPVITHELGQWEIYPDFSEIDKYTGVLAPRNLEVFQSLLEQKGMKDMAGHFLHSSGKLASILYKEEMERVLRTPGMDGFQLLDLHDYPAQGSALVGLLNVFWESKGFITSEEFRESCNDVTLLLKMPKRVWTTSEDFTAEIVLPNYGKKSLEGVTVQCKVFSEGKLLFEDSIQKAVVPQGDVSAIGAVRFPLKGIDKATKLTVCLAYPEAGIKNQYDAWVYPETVVCQQGKVIIARKATAELLAKIRNGASVLLVPEDMEGAERICFANPFWSTLLFDYQPKSMGLYCNPDHPVFRDFPTESYTNWQWWELVSSAYAARINETPAAYRPVLQVIDHPVRNDKLGAIMETQIGKGKLLVCMLDVLSDPDKRIVARQLKYSILKYMNSADFAPVTVPGIEQLFFGEKKRSPFVSVKASAENPEYPVSSAFDGLNHTCFLVSGTTEEVRIELDFGKERYITGCRLPVKADGIDGFDVFVTNDKENWGDAVVSGNGDGKEYAARSWDNGFTIQKGKKGRYVTVVLHKKSNATGRLHELDMIFGD